MRALSHALKMGQNDVGGFTILEILIALIILVVGMLAVGQMQISSIWGNSFSQANTAAMNLAQQQVEEIVRLSYDDPLLINTNAGNDGDLTVKEGHDHEITNGRYTITWNVADNAPILNSKTIVVMASWGANTKTLSFVRASQ